MSYTTTLKTTIKALAVLACSFWSESSLAAEDLASATHLQVSTPTDFAQEIENKSVSLSQWLQEINASKLEFLCLGERHNYELRKEVTRQILTELKMDVLFLEAEQSTAEDLIRSVQSNSEDLPLSQVRHLGAPIGPLIFQALQTSPPLQIWGIEPDSDQKKQLNLLRQMSDTSSFSLSRDSFIAYNLLSKFSPDQRHVALYGASHCAKINVDSGWMNPFYSMVLKERESPEKFKSVKIIVDSPGSFSGPSAENLLLLYLANSKKLSESFVIPNTQDIASESFNSKANLLTLFQAYDTVIVLRPSD